MFFGVKKFKLDKFKFYNTKKNLDFFLKSNVKCFHLLCYNYTDMVGLTHTINYFTNFNKNIFFVSNNNLISQTNLLNYNIYGSFFLKKNFFFSFFNFFWLKNEFKVAKFYKFLYQFNIKLVACIGHHPSMKVFNFFANSGSLIIGAGPDTPKKNLYDFYIVLKKNNILSYYLFYVFLNKYFFLTKIQNKVLISKLEFFYLFYL